MIMAANGAIAWRHGELRGKDVYHVFKHPYKSDKDFITVVGKKPQNATLVKGPGSAYQSVKLLYGRAPSRQVTGDVGIFDFIITPKSAKRVGIMFKPDPKGKTTGDIQVGKGAFPLGDRGVLPNKSKGLRITPKSPKLR